MSATDTFAEYALAPDCPAERSEIIVPHDVNELTDIPRGILVGTAGTIVGRLKDDTADRTFKLLAGEHGLRFRLIKASGTTAADMLALY